MVRIACPAGHRLKLWAKPRGGKGSCPECQRKIIVPPFDLGRLIQEPRQPAPRSRVSDSSTVLHYDEVAGPVGSRSWLAKSDEYSFDYLPTSTLDESTIVIPCRFCGAPQYATAEFCPTCGKR